MMRALVDKLNKYNEAYEQGNPLITDKQYDELYFQLVDMERTGGYALPDSPTQRVDYTVVNALNKVEHEYPMLSLAKTKDWNEFLQYFSDKDVVGMLKLDGLTCALTYENGALVRAETRGNGQVGEDITHNAKVISSIPRKINYYDKLVINGEVICTYENFENFKDNYANPRNFASGSIRLLDSSVCAERHLTFVAWQIASQEIGSFIGSLEFLDSLGFYVVPWTSSFDWDAKEFLLKRAEEEGLPIDGLVGRFDDIKYGQSLGSTGHHSKAAFAFKMYDEEYDTTLLDIEWTMGRTGVLTPIAIFEDVDTGDSVCNRASLHNVSVMYEVMNGGAYKGEHIKMFKSNMIIPQISWAETSIKPGAELINIPEVCPICGQPVEIVESDTGVKNLMCLNPDCQGKLINKLEHFAGKKGLDIKGLSKATLEKLIDWGWVNRPYDLFMLYTHRAEWVEMPGFGEKSVDKVLNAIEEARHTTFIAFLSSLGIPLIGVNMARELAKYFTYEGFRNAINEGYDFTELNGFAENKAYNLTHYDYSEADKIYSDFLDIENPEEESDNTLEGLTIVITGKLHNYKNRAELEDIIRARGGKPVSSVSKKTDILINNDINSTSSKNITAQRYGIPIMTEENFANQFLH